MRGIFSYLFPEDLVNEIDSTRSASKALPIYLKLIVRAALPITLVILVFVLITSIKYVDAPSWAVLDLKLDGQTLANYVGIVFGTVVALVGSLVAIILALRSQSTSEETKILQENANRLAEVANRLAEGERPEYEKAFEAATAYAEFKGNLVLAPMTLRRLQRNGKMAEGALTELKSSSNGKCVDVEGLQAKMTTNLVGSALVSILPALALRTTAGEISQRLIEARIAAVRDADHLILAIDAGLKLAHAIDELVGELVASITSNGAHVDSYISYRDCSGGMGLSELEFWFVRHVLQYSQINRDIDFPDDIGPWREKALKNLEDATGCFLEKRPLNELPSSLFDSHKLPFVTLGFDDATVYLVQREIFANATRAGIEIDLKVIPNHWETRLAEIIQKTHERKQQCSIEKRTIVILDQMDAYTDSIPVLSSSKFNLAQHLLFWKLCELFDDYLNVCDSQECIDNPEKESSKAAQESKLSQIYDILEKCALGGGAPIEPGLDKTSRNDRLRLTWAGWLGGKQTDQVPEIINHAANHTGLCFTTLPEGHSLLDADVAAYLVRSYESNNELPESAKPCQVEALEGKQADQMPEIINDAANRTGLSVTTLSEGRPILDTALTEFLCRALDSKNEFVKPAKPYLLSENDRNILRELRRIPFFDRPIYGWHSGVGILQEVPALTSSDISIVANLYVNAELTIVPNIVIEWLVRASMGAKPRAVVYWA